MRDAGQLIVFDDDCLCRVPGLRLRFGDDHRHWFADMPCLVVGEQRVRAEEDVTAARAVQLHVEFRFRKGIVIDGVETVGKTIRAGEHAQDARHLAGIRRIDANNPRVGMWRAHHGRISLSWKTKVVGELSAAGQQPRVFVARERSPDSLKARRTPFRHD